MPRAWHRGERLFAAAADGASVVEVSATAVSVRAAGDAPAAPGPRVPRSNRGFQLLEAAGWTEGTGLGRVEQGPTEPLGVARRPDRLGLGHVAPPPPPGGKRRADEANEDDTPQLLGAAAARAAADAARAKAARLAEALRREFDGGESQSADTATHPVLRGLPNNPLAIRRPRGDARVFEPGAAAALRGPGGGNNG